MKVALVILVICVSLANGQNTIPVPEFIPFSETTTEPQGPIVSPSNRPTIDTSQQSFKPQPPPQIPAGNFFQNNNNQFGINKPNFPTNKPINLIIPVQKPVAPIFPVNKPIAPINRPHFPGNKPVYPINHPEIYDQFPNSPVFPVFPFPGHTGLLAVPVPDRNLRCYSCNENFYACRFPFHNPDRLKDQLVPCNGQCMQFRNPNDNFLWYRGCSNERFDSQYKPPVVVKGGIVYYFCDVSGCNLF